MILGVYVWQEKRKKGPHGVIKILVYVRSKLQSTYSQEARVYPHHKTAPIQVLCHILDILDIGI